MATDDNRGMVKPEFTEEIRNWYRWLAKSGKAGWAGWCHERRVLVGQLTSKKRWETRRERYGPTGRKPNDYAQWRKDRGLEPINQVIDKAAEG
jgi:hypothetical protein